MSQPEPNPCGSENQSKCLFYGKYRGVVFDNNDPWKIGRVQVKVQAIFGARPSGWALPCVPYAGKGVGLFLIPPIGTLVWVEFENGKPDQPIWSGCFWADEKVGADIVPANPADPEIKVLKTDIGKIEINDKPDKQSITIEAKLGRQPMKIVMDRSGIEINNGEDATVTLKGGKVSINNMSLEVT